MFVDAPSPCVVTEVFDRGEGLDVEAVTERNDSIEPEAYDVGKAGLRGGD